MDAQQHRVFIWKRIKEVEGIPGALGSKYGLRLALRRASVRLGVPLLLDEGGAIFQPRKLETTDTPTTTTIIS